MGGRGESAWWTAARARLALRAPQCCPLGAVTGTVNCRPPGRWRRTEFVCVCDMFQQRCSDRRLQAARLQFCTFAIS